MKKVSIFVVFVCLLASSETANYVPPVTPQMAAARRTQQVDLATESGNVTETHEHKGDFRA